MSSANSVRKDEFPSLRIFIFFILLKKRSDTAAGSFPLTLKKDNDRVSLY